MRLGGHAQQPEEVAVRKENQDEAALRICNVDRATIVHGDSRSMPEACILEPKKRGAVRLKLVHGASSGIRKIHITLCVGGESDRLIELARVVTFFSPRA
jgi:hypothetical protein